MGETSKANRLLSGLPQRCDGRKAEREMCTDHAWFLSNGFAPRDEFSKAAIDVWRDKYGEAGADHRH
jgi:hypothetical protein